MSWWLLLSPLGSAESKGPGEPIQLPVFEVTAFSAAVEIQPSYRNSAEGPRLVNLLIETVRPNTAAAQVGLKPGMEIVRFDGKDVIGMTPEQYALLLRGPFYDALTLRIKISRVLRRDVYREFRIPLPSAPRVKSP